MKKKFGSNLINHKTYVIASDGDFMEGISHESMSLAGHLKLKNLVVFFDNNKISIDGSTNLAVSDDYKKRFESYGWFFQEINGHNEKQISTAIKKALKSRDYSDIHRKHSPLRVLKDSIVIDTSKLNKKQTLDKISKIIEKKLLLKYGRNYRKQK